MAIEDSVAAVRKDTQRREANALHFKRRELKQPEKTHSNSTVAEPTEIFTHSLLQRRAESSRCQVMNLKTAAETLKHSALVFTYDTCAAHFTPS